MPRALLIGNGQTPDTKLLKCLAKQANFILAADGGADRALSAGIKPDAIIGDLDSVSAKAQKTVPAKALLLVDNQNNTDLEKALDWLYANGFTACTLVGFLGGRWDFTLGNFLSVYPYAKKMDLTFCGEGWQIFPVTQDRVFTCRPGARVSLIPLKACSGVTLTGLQFPLKNARLKLGGTGRTLSNQTTGKKFKVAIKTGFLFVYTEE